MFGGAPYGTIPYGGLLETDQSVFPITLVLSESDIYSVVLSNGYIYSVVLTET